MSSNGTAPETTDVVVISNWKAAGDQATFDMHGAPCTVTMDDGVTDLRRLMAALHQAAVAEKANPSPLPPDEWVKTTPFYAYLDQRDTDELIRVGARLAWIEGTARELADLVANFLAAERKVQVTGEGN